jgi:putative ABC transport system permease protein
VVLAIAIGLAGAGAVLDTWALIQRVTREGYLASNPPSATLWTDSIDLEMLERVRALPAVRDAEARRTVMAAAQTPAGRIAAQLFAVDDFTAIRIGAVEPEAGAWPPADGALVVERSSLQFSGAAVGEPLPIGLGATEPVALAVTGVARDVGLAPGWMEHVLYGFVTRATLTRLGAPSSLNELRIVVRDGSLDRAAVRRIAYQVKATLEQAGHRVTDVDVPEPGRHIHAAQMDSLLYTQGAFGLLALVLSAMLVVNLIAAMLAGQVREIGVMKTLGGRNGQIASLYLGVALLLGLVAAALALPTAAFVGYRYAALKAELLNFDVTGYSIPTGALALQLAVGALLPLLAATLPVVRGCRIPVSAALRDFGIAGGGGPSGALLQRVGGVTRPLLLSLRNAFRRRGRMALTLVALATGGAVYLGALNLRASVRGSVDLIYRALGYDVGLRFVRAHRADSLESAIAAVPGVDRAEAWSAARAAVSGPDGTLGDDFVILAPPADSRILAYRPLQGRWLRPGDGTALVVNRRMLEDDPSLAVGGPVTLSIGGRPTGWTVVGVVESGPAPTAYAPREVVAGLLGDGRVDRAVVATALEGPGSQLDLIQRLRAELARQGFEVQTSQLMAESRRVMEDHLLMVVDFLSVMAWLMIAVGGLGLASTMSLAVLERTREIGVLKAIGAKHGAIHLLVQAEALVIAGLSWLLAIPLSAPMSVVLGRAFGRIMFQTPVVLVPAASGLLWWLAVALGVSVVASAWPAFRATRVPTAAALAYE